MSRSLPGKYFDSLYHADPDPWRFATSDYEQAKYDATLNALDGRHFAKALEVGCSIGVLTRRLADRCDRLLALDIAEPALRDARIRCTDLAHVTFARAAIPADWPPGRFDLVVLSEVLYFLDIADIQATARHILATVVPGGCVLLVHWLGATNYPTGGDPAANSFIAACAGKLAVSRAIRTAEYRLDLLT